MKNENTIIEYERGLAERRHKELIGKLKTIAEVKPQTDNGLKEAIESQSRLIKEFLTQISSQPKPQTPNVSVETNQDKVVGSLQDMAKQINENLIALKQVFDNKTKEWNFTVNRRPDGFIRDVTAKAK